MKKTFKFLIDLRFAISILIIICFIIFLGSIIEQDQSIEFYKKHYLIEKPIFGFISWKFITFLQLDHIYKTIWFIVILLNTFGLLIQFSANGKLSIRMNGC